MKPTLQLGLADATAVVDRAGAVPQVCVLIIFSSCHVLALTPTISPVLLSGRLDRRVRRALPCPKALHRSHPVAHRRERGGACHFGLDGDEEPDGAHYHYLRRKLDRTSPFVFVGDHVHARVINCLFVSCSKSPSSWCP
jgi:hypothetical protein